MSESAVTFSTPDLYDDFGSQCQSCETQFRQFGARRRFVGPLRTVRCLGDNALIKQLFEQPSMGDVLVVDGGGLLSSALMGDMIAAAGMKNGWAGVIINGVVRDVNVLATLDIGIKALGSNPRKSTKHGTGEIDVPVTFGGVTFTPGAWLYSDDDGILVAQGPLL